jgi:two-component system response regulator DevR
MKLITKPSYPEKGDQTKGILVAEMTRRYPSSGIRDDLPAFFRAIITAPIGQDLLEVSRSTSSAFAKAVLRNYRGWKRMEAVIRVLLVNQSRFICNVIAAVLEDEPDMQVIGGVTAVDEALALAPNSDVTLINTGMSDGVALKLVRAIADSGLPTKVLAVGLAESEGGVLAYVEAGADGYVLSDESADDLVQRVRDAHAGAAQVSPRIAAALMSRVAEYSQVLDQADGGFGGTIELTPRQQEILELIGQGFTNQQISERLVIQVGTVKNHVHGILKKLAARNRHEAAVIWGYTREGGKT